MLACGACTAVGLASLSTRRRDYSRVSISISISYDGFSASLGAGSGPACFVYTLNNHSTITSTDMKVSKPAHPYRDGTKTAHLFQGSAHPSPGKDCPTGSTSDRHSRKTKELANRPRRLGQEVHQLSSCAALGRIHAQQPHEHIDEPRAVVPGCRLSFDAAQPRVVVCLQARAATKLEPTSVSLIASQRYNTLSTCAANSLSASASDQPRPAHSARPWPIGLPIRMCSP